MNPSGNFEQQNIAPQSEQEHNLETPVVEVGREATPEAPEIYAETAGAEISQESSSVASEGNSKIEDASQGFGFSENALRELRNEYHIDEQLNEIGVEAASVSQEAKSELDLSFTKPTEGTIDAASIRDNNENMEGREVPPQEDATKFGYDERGFYVGEKESREKNRELYRADCLLEGAEAAVRDKVTISNYAVEDLLKTIEDAKARGVDLSQINNLEARVAVLKNAAPQAEIEGSLGYLDKVPETDSFGKASWYWNAFEKFQKYQDSFDVNQKNAFVARLNEAAAKIGIKNEIPSYEQANAITEKPSTEWRDYLGASDEEAAVAEKMSAALVDAITSQDTRSTEKIISTIDRAKSDSALFSGELSKDLESLKLIDVPITGDIYQDTLTLGEQIKDPDIAHYLSQGTPPQEILNEVKRSIQEWLADNKGQKNTFGVLHSMVMVQVIDKIIAADKSANRGAKDTKSPSENQSGVSFEFMEGSEPKVKVRPEKMGELENLRKMSLWDLHLMQERFIEDIKKGRAVDPESRLMLMDVMLEKQREARATKK